MNDWAGLWFMAQLAMDACKRTGCDWAGLVEDAKLGKAHTEFLLEANPAAVAALISELHSLRADALRYRHIRQHGFVELRFEAARQEGYGMEDFDNAVDRARGAL